jgi:hypothetical protein
MLASVVDFSEVLYWFTELVAALGYQGPLTNPI